MPPICIFMKANGFCSWHRVTLGAGECAFVCVFFTRLMQNTLCTYLSSNICRDAERATGCFSSSSSGDTLLGHTMWPRSTLGAVCRALAGDLAILLLPSEGHSPSSVCSRAWICSSGGALDVCVRLPGKGVIPKGSRSNRVIYYTVQLFSSSFLAPTPPSSFSVFQFLAASALASAFHEDKWEVGFNYAHSHCPPAEPSTFSIKPESVCPAGFKAHRATSVGSSHTADSFQSSSAWSQP